MLRIIVVYGLISGAIVIGTIIGSMMVWGMENQSEWLGYLIMVVALSLIFFAIKNYRDRDLGGVIKFGTAFKLGLGISVVAGIVYVGAWETYLQATDANFMEQYAESYIGQLQADGADEQQLVEARALMEEYKSMYEKPLTRMGITFLEIFPVALLITLISAGLLRNSSFLPAENLADRV